MEKTSRRRKYIGKHVKPTDENIMQLLMPSILGMLICMVCLAGATWAWFTATTTVSVPPVSAAYFNVEVAISDSSSNSENNISAGGSEHEYIIASNTNCIVTLTARGNASIGGYCVVTVDGVTYYTPHMSTTVNSEENNTFSFNVCSSSEKITIIPYWGEISDNSVNIISDKTIGSGTVQSADSKGSETPEENTGGGTVNIGGGETGGNDNSAANNDNAGDHNTSPSEQPSSPPANEGKGDSSDNNGGSTADSANPTPSTSDNTAGGSHDSSSASDSGSGSSNSGSGSGGNSDSSSSGGDSGSSSSGSESSGGGSDSRGE